MPGGKKFRVETSNRHYASFINLLIKLYKCLQKPNRTVLIFLRIHMCTTFYAHTKFNIVLFIWTTNLIHLHLCVLCDGSILTLLFLLFWYHFHCMYLLQIYTRYEFVLYKLEQKKKKVFRHHRLTTLVLCCKSLVGSFSYEMSTVRSN